MILNTINKKNICINKKGFSLIEVLVTLFILSLGLVAVSILMAGNIKNSQTAKNQIIASQLGQEGVELVRNMKDNKELDSDPYKSTRTFEDFRIDKNNVLNNGNDKKLYLNNNFYVHDSGDETKFYRRIDISIDGDIESVPSSDRVMTVTSYVTWNGSGFAAMSDLPESCNIANKCVSVVSVLPDYLN